MRDRDFDTVCARTKIIRKDLRAIADFSDDLSAMIPLLDAILAAYDKAIDGGLAKKDMGSIFKAFGGEV